MPFLIVDSTKEDMTSVFIWYSIQTHGGVMIVDLALGFEEFPANFLSRYADLIEACEDDSVLIHLEYDYDPAITGFGSAYPSSPSSLSYDSHVIEVPYKVDLSLSPEHDARVEKFLEVATEYATDWLYLNRWAVDRIGERHLSEYETDVQGLAVDDSEIDDDCYCEIDWYDIDDTNRR